MYWHAPPPSPLLKVYQVHTQQCRLFIGETGSAFFRSSTRAKLCIHAASRAAIDRPPLRCVSDRCCSAAVCCCYEHSCRFFVLYNIPGIPVVRNRYCLPLVGVCLVGYWYFLFERSEFLIATSKKIKTDRLCVWMSVWMFG